MLIFKPFLYKACIFKWQFKNSQGISKQAIILLHVDDILSISDSKDKIHDIVNRFENELPITDYTFSLKYLKMKENHSPIDLHYCSKFI